MYKLSQADHRYLEELEMRKEAAIQELIDCLYEEKVAGAKIDAMRKAVSDAGKKSWGYIKGKGQQAGGYAKDVYGKIPTSAKLTALGVGSAGAGAGAGYAVGRRRGRRQDLLEQ
jgi:hypothetical protein